MGQRPPVLPWVFRETDNLDFTGNFYPALICLRFHLHLRMTLTPGIKIVIWEHLSLITLMTPISHKPFQPAALRAQRRLLAASPPHPAVSWKATAGQRTPAASSGAAGGIFQPFTRKLPRPKPWSDHGHQESAAKTVPQLLQTSLLDSELAWGTRETMRFLQCGEGVVWLLKLLIKGTWSTSNVSCLNSSILASYVLSAAETWILFSSVLLCLQFLWRHKCLFATKVNCAFPLHFLFWPYLFFSNGVSLVVYFPWKHSFL